MISRTAKIIIVAALSSLMAGSFAMPVLADGNTRPTFPDGRKCMSINQVKKMISRQRYTNIQFRSENDCHYVFSAKRKIKGVVTTWEVKYDALDNFFVTEERIYF
jgi:hypothetical protein